MIKHYQLIFCNLSSEYRKARRDPKCIECNRYDTVLSIFMFNVWLIYHHCENIYYEYPKLYDGGALFWELIVADKIRIFSINKILFHGDMWSANLLCTDPDQSRHRRFRMRYLIKIILMKTVVVSKHTEQQFGKFCR